MWPFLKKNGPIGLIAGSGEFPLLFAKAAAALKKELVVFAVRGFTDSRVEAFAKSVYYVELGSLEKFVQVLKSSGIKQVVMAGSYPKRKLYNPDFKLDRAAKDLVSNKANRGDDHLLRAAQLYLKAKCGVSVMDSRKLLKDAVAPRGVLSGRQPTETEWNDLKFGYRAAKAVGKLDIGQTVVVKGGVILAVEAIEGTDNAIRRGGEYSFGGASIVKTAKPKQDLKFDLPCVGPETLKTLLAIEAKALGIEAGKTIMINKEEMITLADKNGIALVGL